MCGKSQWLKSRETRRSKRTLLGLRTARLIKNSPRALTMWWLEARTTIPEMSLRRPKRCFWSVPRTIQMWTQAGRFLVGSRAFARTFLKCLTCITICEKTGCLTITVDRCASKTWRAVMFTEGTSQEIAVEPLTTFNCSNRELAQESSLIRILGRRELSCKLQTSTKGRRRCHNDKQRSHRRTTASKASTRTKLQMKLNA